MLVNGALAVNTACNFDYCGKQPHIDLSLIGKYKFTVQRLITIYHEIGKRSFCRYALWKCKQVMAFLCGSLPLENLMNAIGSWCWPYFDVHNFIPWHCSDVILSSLASQITGVSIVYSTVCSCVDHRIRHSSASLAFMRRIHRWPVNCPHKGPVTRKMFPFDDVTRFRCSSSYAMMSSRPTTWHKTNHLVLH